MIGTSAGAQNLSAYICGQYGYARRVITRYTTSPLFQPTAFYSRGHLIDLDWLVESTSKEFPLHISSGIELMEAGREFYMGASRSDDFEAEFLKPNADTWLDIIRASSAIPGFYRMGLSLKGLCITMVGSVRRYRLKRHIVRALTRLSSSVRCLHKCTLP